MCEVRSRLWREGRLRSVSFIRLMRASRRMCVSLGRSRYPVIQRSPIRQLQPRAQARVPGRLCVSSAGTLLSSYSRNTASNLFPIRSRASAAALSCLTLRKLLQYTPAPYRSKIRDAANISRLSNLDAISRSKTDAEHGRSESLKSPQSVSLLTGSLHRSCEPIRARRGRMLHTVAAR